MKRNGFVVLLTILMAFLVACSDDQVQDANGLESKDSGEVDKENPSSDDKENGDAAEGDSDGSSASGNDSEGTDGSSDGSSDGNSSSDGSSDSSQGSNSSDGSSSSSDGSSSSDNASGSSDSENKNINGTPRSDEEKKSASTYTFAEVQGNAVNVLTGVAAAEIKLSNIPEASKDASVYMVAGDQTIDLTYNEERDSFRNIQIKGIDVAKLQKSEVYVNS